MAIVRMKDVKRLFHPHYILNVVLALSYLVTRTLRPFCIFLFPSAGCELDFRETEILTFLAIIIVFRTKKQGAVSLLPYISTACMYTKIANVLLFFYADPRMGVVFAVLCLLHLLLMPEPTYSGPDHVIYFSGANLEEELQRDKRITWLIAFYAAWNPACVNMAPVFAELSAKYSLENLKFGKVDVARYPDVAQKFRINTSSFSKQLPTIILFRNGQEAMRRPLVDHKGKLINFLFTDENITGVFDLNNLYQECKNNPLKKHKKLKEAEHDKTE